MQTHRSVPISEDDFALLVRRDKFELIMPPIKVEHNFTREELVLLGVLVKLSDAEWCGDMAELGLGSLQVIPPKENKDGSV
jgi:hypothetical protein